MAAKKKPDLTEFYKYSKPKKKPCAIGFVKDQLDSDEEREQLDAALAEKVLITAGAVVQWIEKRVGVGVVNPQNVVSHRNGKCTCYES